MRRIVTGPRLAIRVDADTLLAVPPIHPGTPREVRVRILEAVLRRQVGEAQMLAEAVREDAEGGPERDQLAALISMTPHRNARGATTLAA